MKLTITLLVSSIKNVDNYKINFWKVGSGSAGSIIALRLSANKNNKILLVEAGSHGGRLLNVPMEGPALQGTAADWHHTTVPQNSACFGLKNKVRTARLSFDSRS